MPSPEHSESAKSKSNGETPTAAAQESIGIRLLRIGCSTVSLLVILPALLLVATVSAIFSSPGLYLDGELTGNSYALACTAAAVAIVVAMFRFRRSKSTTGTAVSITASAIWVAVAVLAILGWVFLFGFLEALNGVCNPRC
jgi:hypothetical protein